MFEKSGTNPSRRKFLSFGLIAGAGLLTNVASAQGMTESGETVKMLTQDGKVVEVDKALLKKTSQKKTASKKDVLRWIHPEK
jgi:hypothetical protein